MKKITTVLVAAGFAIAAPAMALAADAGVNADTNSSATMGTDTNGTSAGMNTDANSGTTVNSQTTGAINPSSMTAADAVTALQNAKASQADLSGIQASSTINIIDVSQLEQKAQGDEKQNLQQAVQSAQQSEDISKLQDAVKSNSTVSQKLEAQGFSASDVVAVQTEDNGNQVNVFVNKKSS